METQKKQVGDNGDSKAAPYQSYIDWFALPLVLLVSSYIYDTARQFYDMRQSDGPIDWYHVAFMATCLILTFGALETIKRKRSRNTIYTGNGRD